MMPGPQQPQQRPPQQHPPMANPPRPGNQPGPPPGPVNQPRPPIHPAQFKQLAMQTAMQQMLGEYQQRQMAQQQANGAVRAAKWMAGQ